ncbi:pyruvate formate lyase family protein [Shigella flexneri]
MACGIAGLSVAADSLSAIKYAKVKPVRDDGGAPIDFEIEGEYPQFGTMMRVSLPPATWSSAS